VIELNKEEMLGKLTNSVDMKSICKNLNTDRICDCKPKAVSCIPPKEWVINQLGVWKFSYTKEDIRDKKIHPATYPLSLTTKLISLLSHQKALVVDPFIGSGTTMLAAQKLNRHCFGFDLKEEYISLSNQRVSQKELFTDTTQLAICEDARNIDKYIRKNQIDLIITSPPYADLLNRKRTNKSRRSRKNEQLGKIEQYSQDPRDLGTLNSKKFSVELNKIFKSLLPLLKPRSHCVINVPDFWMDNKRITLHIDVVEAMRNAGFELRNVIIWDKTNLVNAIGIFGYPSNYITMGTSFEYLLDFWKPEISQ